jgi:hypothetical protein
VDSPIPAHLIPEQQRIEALIRRAFRGVSRAGGVSWTESMVIESNGTDADRLEARKQDSDTRWEDLLDGPDWADERVSAVGWTFLDPIGFRYYIAPAMIRCVRQDGGESLSHALVIDSDFARERVSLFTPAQLHTTARLVWFMVLAHKAADDPIYGDAWSHGEAWKNAHSAFWHKHDAGNPNVP